MYTCKCNLVPMLYSGEKKKKCSLQGWNKVVTKEVPRMENLGRALLSGP